MSTEFFHLAFPILETNAEKLKQRILQPIRRSEFLGLAFTFFITLTFAWQHANHIYPYHYDLGIYLKAANGNFSDYFYANWFLPLFKILAGWPFPVAFAFWNFLNIAGIFLASRVFGGKAIWVLTSYQMIYTIFQGNIAGILAGALALTWLCMVNGKWLWSGFFLLIAFTKYQIGIPFGILLLFWAPGDWHQKVRALFFPVIITLLSFIAWGFWPLDVLYRIQNTPPDTKGNLTLWGWIGAMALLVWIPPFIKKFPTQNRLLMLLCAIFLGQPYLQQNDLIVLFSFLPNPIAILGNIGYVLALTRFDLLRFMVFLPFGLYLWAWLDAFRSTSVASKTH